MELITRRETEMGKTACSIEPLSWQDVWWSSFDNTRDCSALETVKLLCNMTTNILESRKCVQMKSCLSVWFILMSDQFCYIIFQMLLLLINHWSLRICEIVLNWMSLISRKHLNAWCLKAGTQADGRPSVSVCGSSLLGVLHISSLATEVLNRRRCESKLWLDVQFSERVRAWE